jgi:hypothetical protein
MIVQHEWGLAVVLLATLLVARQVCAIIVEGFTLRRHIERAINYRGDRSQTSMLVALANPCVAETGTRSVAE